MGRFLQVYFVYLPTAFYARALMHNPELKEDCLKDCIRRIPGMFIGNLKSEGFLNMLEYLLDDIIRDTEGVADIQFDFFPHNNITITISNFTTHKFANRIESLKQEIPLNGLGFSILLALSERADIILQIDKTSISIHSINGDYNIIESNPCEQCALMKIGFTPDQNLFTSLNVVYAHINTFLIKFAYLNPQVRVVSVDNGQEYQRNIFTFSQGLSQQLDLLLTQKLYAAPTFRLDIKNKVNNYDYQVSFCYEILHFTKSYIRSFTNNYETFLGGSLINGVLDGIIKSIKHIAALQNINISITKKTAVNGLILIAVVKGNDFIYRGSTKWKLYMPAIKRDIQAIVFNECSNYFKTNPVEANRLVHRFAIYNDEH